MSAFGLARWVAALRGGAPFWRLGELMRVSGLSAAATRQAVHRLLRQGLLLRLGRGLYASPLAAGGPPTLEQVPPLLYPPAYISLDSALFMHGVADQAPQVLTCVTTNRPRRFHTALGEIHFHRLKPSLFGGDEARGGAVSGVAGGVALASPEKAALDWVYLARYHGRSPALDEWNRGALAPARLHPLAARYPRAVRATLRGFMPAGG